MNIINKYGSLYNQIRFFTPEYFILLVTFVVSFLLVVTSSVSAQFVCSTSQITDTTGVQDVVIRNDIDAYGTKVVFGS